MYVHKYERLVLAVSDVFHYFVHVQMKKMVFRFDSIFVSAELGTILRHKDRYSRRKNHRDRAALGAGH